MKKNEILDGLSLLSVVISAAAADASMQICFALIIVAACCQIAKFITEKTEEHYED